MASAWDPSLLSLSVSFAGTAAVLAGGVDVLYPSENTLLAEEMCRKGGALISEMPMGFKVNCTSCATLIRLLPSSVYT